MTREIETRPRSAIAEQLREQYALLLTATQAGMRDGLEPPPDPMVVTLARCCGTVHWHLLRGYTTAKRRHAFLCDIVKAEHAAGVLLFMDATIGGVEDALVGYLETTAGEALAFITPYTRAPLTFAETEICNYIPGYGSVFALPRH